MNKKIALSKSKKYEWSARNMVKIPRSLMVAFHQSDNIFVKE